MWQGDASHSYLEIRYEDICPNPVAEMERLLESTGQSLRE